MADETTIYRPVSAGNQEPFRAAQPETDRSSVSSHREKQADTNSQSSASPSEGGGFVERFKEKLKHIGNNTRLIDFYSRQKDYYRLLDLIGPLLGSALPWSVVRGSKPRDMLYQESKAIDEARNRVVSTFRSGDTRGWQQAVTDVEQRVSQYREEKDKLEYKYKLKRLNNNLWGDTLNFFLQSGISLFSSWWEKDMVVRTYKDLVSNELNIADPKFEDLKRSQNPIVREATSYYGKKAWVRRLPDFSGLIRWIPKLYFENKKRVHGAEWSDPIHKNTADGAMWKIAETLNGIAMLLGLKTVFFSWYFLERQTGSFYEAENLWRKTEGVSSLPNRGLNQNVMPGEFVTWQEISTFYQRFKEENPKFDLANFTTKDPLSTRVFEQTARYLNHTYHDDLFAMAESNKQKDLPDKMLTHAMLIELVGTKGLRVEDAMGSALKLEVMAHYGALGDPKEGIRQYHKVSKILEKIPHPQPEDYATLQGRVDAVKDYFEKLEGVAREFLGSAWPPYHIVHELKPGFIRFFFGGTQLSSHQVAEMMQAMAHVGPDHRFAEYRNSPGHPAYSIDIEGDKHHTKDIGHAPVRFQNTPAGINVYTDQPQKAEEKEYTRMVERKDPSHISQRSLKDYALTPDMPPGATIQ